MKAERLALAFIGLAAMWLGRFCIAGGLKHPAEMGGLVWYGGFVMIIGIVVFIANVLEVLGSGRG